MREQCLEHCGRNGRIAICHNEHIYGHFGRTLEGVFVEGLGMSDEQPIEKRIGKPIAEVTCSDA